MSYSENVKMRGSKLMKIGYLKQVSALGLQKRSHTVRAGSRRGRTIPETGLAISRVRGPSDMFVLI